MTLLFCVFFFQAEDGIRDLVRSRGLGDVYKRQTVDPEAASEIFLRDCIVDLGMVIAPVGKIRPGEILSLIHI